MGCRFFEERRCVTLYAAVDLAGEEEEDKVALEVDVGQEGVEVDNILVGVGVGEEVDKAVLEVGIGGEEVEVDDILAEVDV